MVRKGFAILITLFLLPCLAFASVTYKMRSNQQTGRGDWVTDISTLTPTDVPGLTFEPLLPNTPENPETKYLNGNRQWAEIVIGSGGYAANIYFTVTDSDVVGYKRISYTNDPTTSELTASITAGTTLLRTYLYDSGLNISTINDGVWRFKYSVKVDKTAGVTKLMVVPFVRHIDGSETNLFTAYSAEIDNTTYADALIDFSQPSFSVATTDRLGVRVYGYTTSVAAVVLSSQIGDGSAAYFNTPLSPRHSQIRDLNGDAAYQHINASDRVAITANMTNRKVIMEGDLSGIYSRGITSWKIPYIDYGYGITITSIVVQANVSDPTTELTASIRTCDNQSTGAFPGANVSTIATINTTTGNYSSTGRTDVIATGKILYLYLAADPTDTGVTYTITITYDIKTS